MTTTDLIDLLKKNEHGGATGRPREVMICVGDEIYDTDITDISTGDGLITELFLEITPKPERKTGRWERVTNSNNGIDFRCSACHRYRFHNGEMRKKYKFCPNCGTKMEVEHGTQDA